MGELCDFDVNGDLESLWSEELDRVPLKQRLEFLLKLEDFDVNETGIDANVKREDEHFEPQVTHSACDSWEGISDTVSSEESGPEECNRREIGANDDVALSNYNVKLEPEIIENHSLSSLDTCQIEASIANVQECEMSTEGHEVFLDDLDRVVLKERRRMLLSREVLGFNKPVEGNISGLSSSADFLIKQSDGIRNGECISDCNDSVMEASHLHDMVDENASGLLGASPIDTSPCPAFTHNCQGTTCTSGIFANMNESSGVNSLSCDQMTGLRSDLPIFANVKAEPVDSSDSQIPSKKAQDFVVLPVKSEAGFIDESLDDKIDHMLLRERMISRASKGMPSSATYGTSIFSGKIGPSSFDYSSAGSSKPQRMKRPRKRRKTATDSVETAMEEDAPGLLQILLEKGVLLDEIKLYNEMESDEVLDDSLTENSFAELEAVILKLFSERQSLFKFAPIRCGKAERVSYCLACLISLVEQARYLQFRNWPVEWGWCRDLQSFIFVFERHNRIVLERPEYGYATYFFELTDSLSINWQIKRLVTAMKLTSCSRVTLIENRALTVGDDLTEGEAKVLMEYGWVPDTGLGTMLNYCDRVVHDRKNEKDSSEWRTKIGKLLLDGYNGGTIVSTDFSKHVTEHGSVQSPEIKLEL